MHAYIHTYLNTFFLKYVLIYYRKYKREKYANEDRICIKSNAMRENNNETNEKKTLIF